MSASPKRVITGKVRASYAFVWSPRRNDQKDTMEYTMSVLVDKTDAETLAKLRAAYDFAVTEKWGDNPPKGLFVPLRDGDEDRPDDPAYAGQMFLTAKSDLQPGIIDAQRQPVLDSAEFQSGDYCRVSLQAFAWEWKTRRGVSFGLNNIQVLSKGEPLGRTVRAEDDFEEWNDEETAAAPW